MKKKTNFILIFFLILSFILPLSNTFASDDLQLNVENYIVIEASTGKIVCEKNSDKILPPASTTKVMTAILTLENCNLNDIATVSRKAIYSVPTDYTHANLKEGEQLTINNLLNVLLIPSANDSAYVLAEHVAGSVDSFATMMNTKAQELGCKNTHFVNPSGIHDENHYSTAADLAIIARYAMQNEAFREIVSKQSYTLPATNKYPNADRFFKNTNELIIENKSDSIDNYYYPYAIGIKTGYTSPAKDCLISAARKNDTEYICVILGAEKTANFLSARFIDAKKLFDYAFDNYKIHTINEKGSVLKQIEISNANIFDKKLDLIIQDKIDLVIKNNEDLSNITPEIKYSSDLLAPITENSILGTITYTIGDNTYTSNLIASRNVADGTVFNTTLTIFCILLILFLLYKLLKPKKNKKHGRKN